MARRALRALVSLALGACAGAPGTSARGTPPAIADDGGASEGASPPGDAGVPPASAPFPLGATYDATNTALHFRLRAPKATRVELDLFVTPAGAAERATYLPALDPATGIWAADVPLADLAQRGVTGVVYYGYRVWGPNWPYDASWTKGTAAGFVADVDGAGNRFNPNKLLLDPYTREVSHDPLTPTQADGSAYMTGPAARTLDSGPIAPKGIALPGDTTSTGTAPARAFKDDVIYEVHVRGLTNNDPTVAAVARGTYLGAAAKADYLAGLGVTAVELLPIHETQNDRNDVDPGSANYWGYSTYAFFAPDRRFASDKSPGGPSREWKAMVKAFHDRGMKVLLDVVYNHTGEGGVSGKDPNVARVVSFRGLDNAGYYELAADHRTPVDDTGTGGNANAASPIFRDLVVDSLQHWTQDMGVDGFRFDLAPILGNSCTEGCFIYDRTDPNNVLNRAVATMPGVPLIAEPWGVGPGTYQLGNLPDGWSEWNGVARDLLREAQNKLTVVPVSPLDILARLTASPDLWKARGRKPWASIQYVDCHDGFTLRDEYAYDQKNNNLPYPLGPSPGGTDANNSWDQGGAPAAQRQAARTALMLVGLGFGVPMIAGGDEMYRTQYGNNNAYNLDDDKMWLDWSQGTSEAALVTFTSNLFAFRALHPALRPASYLDGTDHNGNGLPDLGPLTEGAGVASFAYLTDTTRHFLAYRIDGTELADPARSIYVAYDPNSAPVTVTLPQPASGMAFYLAGDSSATFAAPGQETAWTSPTYPLGARTIAVFVER